MDSTTTPPTPTGSAPISPGSVPELTDIHAETVTRWIKEDLEKGTITPEQAANAFDELNATMEQRAPDLRSDEVKALDEQFPPAAKPDDYTIHYGQDMTPALKQFDQAARTWIHAAEFPRELGTALAKTIDDVTRHTASMNEDQLAEFGYREYAKLKRLYGEQLESKLQAAGRMVHQLEAKQPGLKQLLKSRGIGDSARVTVLLLDQAERYWRRHSS